jgi:hypothetical protein
MSQLVIKNARSSKTRGENLLTIGKSFNFITQSLKTKFIDSFESDLDSNPLYIFYGRANTWDSPADTYEADSPPQPSNAIQTDIDARRDMLAVKRINPTDTKVAFRKVVWKSNTVFDQYDTTIDQTVDGNNNYYIIQDDPTIINYGAVYKCLDNNNGSVSKYKPYQYINPAPNPQVLPDNYKWKYMFTVSGSDLSKFSTDQSPNNFVPINADTSFKTPSGTIDRIDIDSPGFGYKPIAESNGKYYGVYDSPVVPFFVDGDGIEIDSAQLEIASVNGGAITAFKNDEDSDIKYGAREDKYTLLANPKYNNWVPVKFIEDLESITFDNELTTTTGRTYAYGLAKIGIDGKIATPNDVKIISGGSNYAKGNKVRVVQPSCIAFGVGYHDSPAALSGDASSAKISNGIQRVIIESVGQNYANATLVPIHGSSDSEGPAGFKSISQIAPLQGHGGDPKLELAANAIFINSRILGRQGNVATSNDDFPSVNDFRQVGLIQNAKNLQGANLDLQTASAKYMMVLDDVNNSIETLRTSGDAVSKDLLIQGVTSRAKGRVVDIFSGEGVEKEIRYVQIGTRKFIPSEYIIYKDISDAIRIKSIREPEIDVYTGNILYINNNSKIQRDENQTETINFLITF